MSNGAVIARVRVIEDSSKEEGYRFETTDLPMGPKNVLYFRSCKKGQDFHIYYTLEGFADYTFPDLTNDNDLKPLWVSHGNNATCPTQGTPKWGQFDAIDIADEGRTLIVENKNNQVVSYFYTLRIKNAAGDVKLIDPGGENWNGGMPLTRALLATGALTGGIVGVGSVALANSALDPQASLIYGVGGAVVGLILGFVLARI